MKLVKETMYEITQGNDTQIKTRHQIGNIVVFAVVNHNESASIALNHNGIRNLIDVLREIDNGFSTMPHMKL